MSEGQRRKGVRAMGEISEAGVRTEGTSFKRREGTSRKEVG